MTDYTLVGGAGTFALTGYGTPARLFAGTGAFTLTGQVAQLRRLFDVAAGDLVLKLARLNSQVSIVDRNGKPTPQFQRFWQRHCEGLETAFENLVHFVLAIQAAYDAAAQANMAASNANNAVAEVEDALVEVQETADQVTAGTFNYPYITVGNSKFGNDGSGGLIEIP